MFKQRLISGIVLVIIAFLTIYNGGLILWGTLAIVSLIGMRELYAVVKNESSLLGIAGYLCAIGFYLFLLLKPGETHYQVMMFIILIIAVMSVYVFQFPKYTAEQVTMTFFGVIYVAVMLSYIYQTRMLKDGLFIVALVFLCSWGCDTCAYCVGVLIGKHKMAPKLSPKKSVEGGIGGLVGAALLGALYALAFG